jgi:hypothetical protein
MCFATYVRKAVFWDADNGPNGCFKRTGVSVAPGATELTRTPDPASSSAAHFVSISRHDFDTENNVHWGRATGDAEILTIAPAVYFKNGAANETSCSGTLTLIIITKSNSSDVIS